MEETKEGGEGSGFMHSKALILSLGRDARIWCNAASWRIVYG